MKKVNIRKDWLISQIEELVQLVARLVFQRDSIEYQMMDKQNRQAADILHKKLAEFVDENKICEAENFLYSNLDIGNQDFLVIAMDFYQSLNKKSDEELENNNFSRQEVQDGIHSILKEFGISLPGGE